MEVIEQLDSKNFTLYAFRNYNNPQCVDIEEFYEDLKRFKYLKKLINRYLDTGSISERLLLNHIITLQNVFGVEALRKMLEYKMNEVQWPVIKPCLLFLGYIAENEYLHVQMDPIIIDMLRKL